MDYHNFSADDFIKDDHFQKWVLVPNEESNAFWKDFLQEYPHLHPDIQEARQFLLIFHFKEEDVFESRIASLKKRIDRAIDFPAESNLKSSSPRNSKASKKNPWRFYAIAASIVFILFASVGSFFLTRSPHLGNLFSFNTRKQVTPKGQRSVLTLEDGTKVWINADSRLEYPKSFAGEKLREVWLSGEAYFDVTENKLQPFIVHTSDIDIKVLGTSFNVRSYDKDDLIETTLIKGKVTINSSDDSKPVVLLPNQQAVFEKVSGKISLENTKETEDFTSWKEGRLVFNDQPLSVIVNELERWFNVSIVVEDKSSLGCHFSAKVNDKTLVEVLELFKASETITYSIDGSNVSIRGKLCTE